ncbi:MAG: NnrU family protein [Pseudomonadota bacterium]
MEALTAALLFLGSHALIARTAIRPWLVQRIGEPGYLAGYSLLSLVLLAWLVMAILVAHRVPLWPTPSWAPVFAVVVSALAFALLGAGALSPNPYSVAFRRAGFEPKRPGIVGWLRHPLIYGFGLWGLAHVPANGEWPPLLLFAGTVVFALLGARSVGRRRAPGVLGPGGLDRQAVLGIAVGLLAWGVFLCLHPLLFGADPLGLLRAQLGV